MFCLVIRCVRSRFHAFGRTIDTGRYTQCFGRCPAGHDLDRGIFVRIGHDRFDRRCQKSHGKGEFSFFDGFDVDHIDPQHGGTVFFADDLSRGLVSGIVPFFFRFGEPAEAFADISVPEVGKEVIGRICPTVENDAHFIRQRDIGVFSGLPIDFQTFASLYADTLRTEGNDIAVNAQVEQIPADGIFGNDPDPVGLLVGDENGRIGCGKLIGDLVRVSEYKILV